jgi:hypothetical protein
LRGSPPELKKLKGSKMKQLKSVCLAAVFVLLSTISGRAFADDGGGGGDGGGDGGDDGGGDESDDSGPGDCGNPSSLSDALSSAENAVVSVNDIAAIVSSMTGQPVSVATISAQIGTLSVLSNAANNGQLSSNQMSIATSAAQAVQNAANMSQEAITELSLAGDLADIQTAIDAQTQGAVAAVTSAINASP